MIDEANVIEKKLRTILFQARKDVIIYSITSWVSKDEQYVARYLSITNFGMKSRPNIF